MQRPCFTKRAKLSGITRRVLWVICAGIFAVGIMACQQESEVAEPTSTAPAQSATAQPAQLPAAAPAPRPAPTPAIAPPSIPAPAAMAAKAPSIPTSTPAPAAMPTPTVMPAPTSTPAVSPTPTALPSAETPIPAATPSQDEILAALPTATPTVEELLVLWSDRITPTPTPINPRAAAEGQLAQLVPWYADPQGGIHKRAAGALLEIWVASEGLGRTVAAFPWVLDGMTLDESAALEVIGNQAFWDPGFAVRMVSLDWIADGAGVGESVTLEVIFGSPIEDMEAAVTLIDYYWVQDGLTVREEWGLIALMQLNRNSPAIAQQVIRLPWIADGLSDVEAEGLRDLQWFLQFSPETAELITRMPWFADGINWNDANMAYSLNRLNGADREFALALLAHTWISEPAQPDSHHWQTIGDLSSIAATNLSLAWRLSSSLDSGFRWEQRRLISSIAGFMRGEGEAGHRLKLKDWFWDGLSPEEEAFLLVAPDILHNAPDQFYDMLTVRYVESRTIQLPLSGTVNIRLVKKDPFTEAQALLSETEMALRLLEKLTKTPLPVQEIVILIAVVDSQADFERSRSNPGVNWPTGAHAGVFIRLAKYGNEPVSRGTLFHELAHYYFMDFPVWFMEGGAEFANSYIISNSVYGSEAQWQASVDRVAGRGCASGESNLAELGNPGFTYTAQPNVGCFYGMGQLFLSSLYFALGEEVMSETLKDIFAYTRSPVRGPLTSKDIYRFFQQNLKPGQERQFNDLFRLLHGGPLSEPVSGSPDDHANEMGQATPMALGTTIHGALANVWDTDYFTFTAEAGTGYTVVIQHNIDSKYIGPDLRVRLFSPSGGEPNWILRPGRGADGGVETFWIAPKSGRFHLAVDSTVGLLGEYSLFFGDQSIEDDHGNYPEYATAVVFGEEIAGRLDSASDVDYFRISAIENWGYAIRVENITLGWSKVDGYGPDGRLVETHGSSWGVSRSRFVFRAKIDGEHFLAVYSPHGESGEYSLVVEQQIPSTDVHDDKPSWATEVEVGELVQASLDDSTDRDFYRFSAVGGNTYHFKVNYLDLYDQPLTLYDSDGVTPLGPTRPFGLESYGSILSWVAPNTADYYLEMHSPDGDTGGYELKIIWATAGADDHGNIQRGATDLEVGVPARGVLNHGDDFDYFRLTAQGGKRYEILAQYDLSALDETLISFYDSRGITSSAWHRDKRRQSGKYLTWDARYSGEYYVIIWNPKGETGAYTLTVTMEDIPRGARPYP